MNYHSSPDAGKGRGTASAKAPSRPPGSAGPGVPLSVRAGLPVPPGSADGPPCGGSVTRAAATHIIESFTGYRDLVVTIGELPTAAQAASEAGRAVAVLAPGRDRGPLSEPGAGQAALAITGYCGTGCCALAGLGDDSGGLLYAACEKALRPGGVLAVLIAGPGADEHCALAGNAVAAARAASLVYVQHIALVHAVIDGDHLDPGPVPGTADATGTLRAHSDLLIFTKPDGGTRL